MCNKMKFGGRTILLNNACTLRIQFPFQNLADHKRTPSRSPSTSFMTYFLILSEQTLRPLYFAIVCRISHFKHSLHSFKVYTMITYFCGYPSKLYFLLNEMFIFYTIFLLTCLRIYTGEYKAQGQT